MTPPPPIRVAIACGGTGGHIFPGLAVAEEVRRRGGKALLLISKKQIDATALQKSNFPRRVLSGAEGLQSRNPAAILRFAFLLGYGILSASRALAAHRPMVVLGMGGFTSFGPVVAARLRQIPSVIHESNAIPGKANRLNARFANLVLLGLEGCRPYFKRSLCETVGTPIRPEIRSLPDRSAARATLGFNPEAKVVLFTGGSQGARGLNTLALGAAAILAKEGFSFIHLSGEADLQRVTQAYRTIGCPHLTAAFSSEMPFLLAASDVALSRAGAASLSEIACAGLPSLLLPYPHAAEDHQTRNAEVFTNSGAALMLSEYSASPEAVAAALRELTSPTRATTIKSALERFAPRDAHTKVVNALEQIAYGHSG